MTPQNADGLRERIAQALSDDAPVLDFNKVDAVLAVLRADPQATAEALGLRAVAYMREHRSDGLYDVCEPDDDDATAVFVFPAVTDFIDALTDAELDADRLIRAVAAVDSLSRPATAPRDLLGALEDSLRAAARVEGAAQNGQETPR